VVFERHRTEAGQSGVAYASIFGGVQADRHGIFHHPARLPDSVYTVAEAFAEGGSETWFYSGQAMGGAGNNYGQGVPGARTLQYGKTEHYKLSANDDAFDAVLEHLVADPGFRAFVQINFTVTHHAYHKHIAPKDFPAWRRRTARALGIEEGEVDSWLELYTEHRLRLQWDFENTARELGLTRDRILELAAVLESAYRQDVTHLDELFGRLLNKISRRGLDDCSLVAFTADHGELLFRPGALFQWTHGYQLAPEVLDVPLILRGEGCGITPGRYAPVTRSIDLAPTLAGLCGLEPEPDAWAGENLAPALRGQSRPPELVAFSHTAILDDFQRELAGEPGLRERLFPTASPAWMWVAFRRADRVFLRRPGEGGEFETRCFDLASDPLQTRDLYDANDPAHREATRRLREYKESLAAAFRERVTGNADPAVEDSERLRLLRELGYVR
jgi:arylsulfatase A-like enzyme